jgi:hypothetical protein
MAYPQHLITEAFGFALREDAPSVVRRIADYTPKIFLYFWRQQREEQTPLETAYAVIALLSRITVQHAARCSPRCKCLLPCRALRNVRLLFSVTERTQSCTVLVQISCGLPLSTELGTDSSYTDHHDLLLLLLAGCPHDNVGHLYAVDRVFLLDDFDDKARPLDLRSTDAA